ncbi:MAG: AAA family ATPase, partial [SAR202 cluster bacterium]|nr:AAA family ATPase [SAR202 cluster bacterium]
MAAELRENVQRVIVGKGGVIDLAIIALLCKGHILVEDVPGIGKTTLSKALAQSLGCSFSRIQFTPDLMPTDVLGVNFYNQKSGDFEFRSGPIFSQILLADEINRATPRTQSALLEAMQERQATIDGETRMLKEPFLVMA